MSTNEPKADAFASFYNSHRSMFNNGSGAETACADIGAKSNKFKIGGRVMAYSAREMVAAAQVDDEDGRILRDALLRFDNDSKGPIESTQHWFIIADGFLRVEKHAAQLTILKEQVAITEAKAKLDPIKARYGMLRDAISGPRTPRQARNSKVQVAQLTPEQLEQVLKLTEPVLIKN